MSADGSRLGCTSGSSDKIMKKDHPRTILSNFGFNFINFSTQRPIFKVYPCNDGDHFRSISGSSDTILKDYPGQLS